MSLSSVWRTLLRRWYVTLVGLLITIGLVYAASVLSPPTYEARAAVLLIPPKTQQSANPYLGLGGLQEVSDVLSRAVSDTQTADAVTGAGGSAKFSVGRDTSTTGPIILVTADATSAAQALLTDKLLIERMGPALANLQATQNVPDGSYIDLIILSSDQKASIQRKSQLRACIAAGAIGLLLTVLLVAFAEKTANRRRNRREAAGTADEDGHAAPRAGHRRKPKAGEPGEVLPDDMTADEVPARDVMADDEPADVPVDAPEPAARASKPPATSGSRSRGHG